MFEVRDQNGDVLRPFENYTLALHYYSDWISRADASNNGAGIYDTGIDTWLLRFEFDMDDNYAEEEVSLCPVCAESIDYCQGHGEIGDPVGFAVMEAHDAGDHSNCHPIGCAGEE